MYGRFAGPTKKKKTGRNNELTVRRGSTVLSRSFMQGIMGIDNSTKLAAIGHNSGIRSLIHHWKKKMRVIEQNIRVLS